MANYKINKKSKSISVSGVLTETEKEILSTYIKSGYVVREKRATNAATVKDDDIIAYFDEKKDADGKAKYEAENLTLSPDFPLGVSNSFTDKECEIEVRDGVLLVMREI